MSTRVSLAREPGGGAAVAGRIAAGRARRAADRAAQGGARRRVARLANAALVGAPGAGTACTARARAGALLVGLTVCHTQRKKADARARSRRLTGVRSRLLMTN